MKRLGTTGEVGVLTLGRRRTTSSFVTEKKMERIDVIAV